MTDERAKRANMILRQRTGVEMTPEQFKAERDRTLDQLRAKLRAKGHKVPESTEEFRRLIQRALRR